MSKEVFIRMREEEYSQIPNELKERYFNSHNVTSEVNDFVENMLDPVFNKLYSEKKKITKQLEKRQYELREERRKIKNIFVNLQQSEGLTDVY